MGVKNKLDSTKLAAKQKTTINSVNPVVFIGVLTSFIPGRKKRDLAQ